VLIPPVANMIKKFIRERNLDEDSKMDSQTLPMIEMILNQVLDKAKLKSDATILSIFNNLKLSLEKPAQTDGNDDDYDST
jgi:hypothetical protein